MSSFDIVDMKGQVVGTADLPDSLLQLEKGQQAVQDAVVAHLAARRAGTASTLSKGEVAGSNRKPWRQKGTGRARAGLRQSPVWRGGGVAFGPHPRSYEKKVNRKVARLAFQRALSEKIAANAIKIVDELQFAGAKTKEFAGVLRALQVKAPALVVADRVDPNVSLSARNIPGIEMVSASGVNVYQLLRYPTILVTRKGFDGLKLRVTGRMGSERS